MNSSDNPWNTPAQPSGGGGGGGSQPGAENSGAQFSEAQFSEAQFSGTEPKKQGGSSSTLPKVLAIILVVLLGVGLLGEFGTRWFIKDQISTALQENTSEAADVEPKVSLGSSPVLFGLIRATLPHLEIEIPSTVQVDYEDNDQQRPVVTGVPRTRIVAKDMKMGSSEEEMIFGEMEVHTDVPKEIMLAELAGGQGSQDEDALSGLMQVTDIVPDTGAQTLEVEIGGGLASLIMAPAVEDGELVMRMDGVEVFGMRLPDSLAESMQGAMEDSAKQAMPGGLEITGVKVTEEGMELSMSGRDVNMNQLEESIDQGAGAGSGGEGRGGAGAGGSEQRDSGDRAPAEQDSDPTDPDHRPGPEDKPGAVGSGGEIFNRAAA